MKHTKLTNQELIKNWQLSLNAQLETVKKYADTSTGIYQAFFGTNNMVTKKIEEADLNTWSAWEHIEFHAWIDKMQEEVDAYEGYVLEMKERIQDDSDEEYIIGVGGHSKAICLTCTEILQAMLTQIIFNLKEE